MLVVPCWGHTIPDLQVPLQELVLPCRLVHFLSSLCCVIPQLVLSQLHKHSSVQRHIALHARTHTHSSTHTHGSTHNLLEPQFCRSRFRFSNSQNLRIQFCDSADLIKEVVLNYESSTRQVDRMRLEISFREADLVGSLMSCSRSRDHSTCSEPSDGNTCSASMATRIV